MATRGGTTTLAELQALAGIANSKNLPFQPYAFAPEYWEVDSEEAMLKLGCADRGDSPGGLAIRTDQRAVYRLTGPDYTDIASWSPYPAIAVFYQSTPTGGSDGSFAYAIGVNFGTGLPTFNAMYQKISGTWTQVGVVRGQWRGEINRIRTGIIRWYTLPAHTIPPPEADGEIYWPGIWSKVAYSTAKYCFTRGVLSWPQSLGNFAYTPFKELEYVSDTVGASATLKTISSLAEYAPDKNYDGTPWGSNQVNSHTELTFRIRFEMSAACSLDTMANSNFGTGPAVSSEFVLGTIGPAEFPAIGQAEVSIVSDSSGFATLHSLVLSPTNKRWFLKIAGSLPQGVSEINIVLRVEPPHWYFKQGFVNGNFNSYTDTFGQAVANPRLYTSVTVPTGAEIAAISKNRPVRSAPLIALDQSQRIASRIRAQTATGGTIFNGVTVDFWYVDNVHQAIANAPGFFRSKVAGVGAIDPILRIPGGGDSGGRPLLAPRSEDAISNADRTVRIGFIEDSDIPAQQADPGAIRPPFPRCFFKRTTDVPNQIELRPVQGAITTPDLLPAGCTIPIVTVRRIGRGEPSLVDASQPLNVKIGCIQNGSFHVFENFTMSAGTESRTWYPDWVIYTPHSLAYECDEVIDIQAAVFPAFASNGEGAFGGIFDGNALRLADFYNNTLEQLSLIPS